MCVCVRACVRACVRVFLSLSLSLNDGTQHFVLYVFYVLLIRTLHEKWSALLVQTFQSHALTFKQRKPTSWAGEPDVSDSCTFKSSRGRGTSTFRHDILLQWRPTPAMIPPDHSVWHTEISSLGMTSLPVPWWSLEDAKTHWRRLS